VNSIYGIYGFGHATTIPICNWIFSNFFGGWEIQRAFQQAITCKILTLFAKVMTFSFFFSNESMLSTIAIATKSAKNNPKLPNFVKICLNTITLRNFEIPPKIEILIFSLKKSYIYRMHQSMFSLFGCSIQQFFVCLFYCQKMAFVCEFQHTPCGK
jgi:hypothetical protein